MILVGIIFFPSPLVHSFRGEEKELHFDRILECCLLNDMMNHA